MAILAFQMPEKVVVEQSSNKKGIFTFKPLEKGYGITIGNSLRRILLSSLEGHAITGMQMTNVLHEFSTVEGIVEDVSEIILNLKQVRLKKVGEFEENRLSIKVSGKEVLTAGDLTAHTNSYEILNPDMVIFHMDSDKSRA